MTNKKIKNTYEIKNAPEIQEQYFCWKLEAN